MRETAPAGCIIVSLQHLQGQDIIIIKQGHVWKEGVRSTIEKRISEKLPVV